MKCFQPGFRLLPFLRRIVLISVALTGLSGLFPPTAQAATSLRVTSAADGPLDTLAGNGTCELREAIAAINDDATGGDCARTAGATTITFNTAVTGIILRDGHLRIRRSLTIEGPGTASLSIDANRNSRLLRIDAGAEVTISELTLTNGRADNGGAIRNDGTLTLRTVHVIDSYADEQGGGIINSAGARLTLSENSIVARNTAAFNGGGISHQGEELRITESVVRDNQVTGSPDGQSRGGGICQLSGLLVIERTRIHNNRAFGTGGGISINAGSATITSSTISDNQANGTTPYGGGIAVLSATLQLDRSTISSNQAAWAGGILLVDSTATLRNCTLSGNSATDHGTAIFNAGGARDKAAQLLVDSCTITGHEVNQDHGNARTIHTDLFADDTGVITELRNTLVAGNSSINFHTSESTQLVSLGHNLDSDGSSGFTNGANNDRVGAPTQPLDARLGPLSDNGGPTLTHALLAGSPAIGAGPASGCPATDQRGVARPAPSNTRCDTGAFEEQEQVPPPSEPTLVPRAFLPLMQK